LRKFADYPQRLGDLGGNYSASEMWHETNAVKTGTIRRKNWFPTDPADCVFSGPHVYIANPRFKVPTENWAGANDYRLVDLTVLGNDDLPRCNFAPDCDPSTYRSRTPRLAWDREQCITDVYRVVNREMVSPAWERTLLAAIVSPGISHINVLVSTAFRESSALLRFASGAASLPVDFRVKTTGMGHINKSMLDQLPLVTGSHGLFVRTLLLNCLTRHYVDLWRESFNSEFAKDGWAKQDSRLDNARFTSLTADWSWHTPLRTDYERRQALIEIDVLVAMELGLTCKELCTIYRIQFPLLHQYERNTFYDGNGRIVYLDGDAAYGLSTPEWKRNREKDRIERTIEDDTLSRGKRTRTIVYEAPFNSCDREEDYRTVFAEFERRGLEA
jgi:hypothetical protein